MEDGEFYLIILIMLVIDFMLIKLQIDYDEAVKVCI